MIVTEETKAAAQAVVDYLTVYPERHEQSTVWGDEDGNEITSKADEQCPDDICGTTLCIAGTTLFLDGGIEAVKETVRKNTWITDAGAKLGLDWGEAYELFHTWDEQKAFDATVAIANGDQDKFYSKVDM